MRFIAAVAMKGIIPAKPRVNADLGMVMESRCIFCMAGCFLGPSNGKCRKICVFKLGADAQTREVQEMVYDSWAQATSL